MILITLLIIPLLGILIINTSFTGTNNQNFYHIYSIDTINKRIKMTGLISSIISLIISLIIFILFDFSSNQYQFVQEYHE